MPDNTTIEVFFSTAEILLVPLLLCVLLHKKWRFPKSFNYKKELIPTGYGILFTASYLIWILRVIFGFIYAPSKAEISYALRENIFFILPIIVVLVGYYDDVRGQKSIKGLSSNIKNFFSTGRLTSSLIKAFVVFVCAFKFSLFYSSNWLKAFDTKFSLLEHVLNSLVIALFTNFFNLMDLRPGRALKIFALLYFLIIARYFSHPLGLAGWNPIGMGLSLSLFSAFFLLIPLLFYAPLDFRGQAMMGDAGSNMLGFVLGIGYAVILPLPAKIAVVILLTLFHIYCEFYSFSDFISRNRVLRYLDEFGTCMRENKK